MSDITTADLSQPVTVVTITQPAVMVVQAGMGLQGVPGPQGPPGGAGFTYLQAAAAVVWTVPHNLNRYPSVTVTDNLANVVMADVAYIDANVVQITHRSAEVGSAYFN